MGALLGDSRSNYRPVSSRSPCPDARDRSRVHPSAIGGLRLSGRCALQAPGLRDMFGGRDQMGDKGRVGAGDLARDPRPLRRHHPRRQRAPGGRCVGQGCLIGRLIHRLIWPIAVGHLPSLIRLNCHVLGRATPLDFHHRKGHAGPRRFVPGRCATWFAESLSTSRRIFSGQKMPRFNDLRLFCSQNRAHFCGMRAGNAQNRHYPRRQRISRPCPESRRP